MPPLEEVTAPGAETVVPDVTAPQLNVQVLDPSADVTGVLPAVQSLAVGVVDVVLVELDDEVVVGSDAQIGLPEPSTPVINCEDEHPVPFITKFENVHLPLLQEPPRFAQALEGG